MDVKPQVVDTVDITTCLCAMAGALESCRDRGAIDATVCNGLTDYAARIAKLLASRRTMEKMHSTKVLQTAIILASNYRIHEKLTCGCVEATLPVIEAAHAFQVCFDAKCQDCQDCQDDYAITLETWVEQHLIVNNGQLYIDGV